ncbi:MAG: hypothetical protein JNK82_30935 [Myxococcaceae bacterium]|nr:hypothetical protein [Myxococcaceae bacterium]
MRRQRRPAVSGDASPDWKYEASSVLTLLLPALLSAAAPSKPVVSVLYFENRTTDASLQVLQKGMAEMIITDLVAWDGVTVVERSRLDAVLGELKLQQTKAFDPGTAVKVGKLIGAQYAITGSLFLQGEQLRIDAAVVNIERGETVASASAAGSKDTVFDLEQKLVDQLVTAIDVKLKGGSARSKAKVPSFDALVAYSKAIDLSDQGRHDEASKAMAALVSKSPTFVMAREKKVALLEKLKEYEERKKDLVSAAVLEVGKRADDELKKPFASKSVQGKQTHLLWRQLKARFLMRVLKQSLVNHKRSVRIIRPGEEARALSVMQQWLENQRGYLAELKQVLKSVRSPDADLNKLGLFELVRDSGLDPDNRISFDVEWDTRRMNAFIVMGRANDGDSFDVAPPLGALDPKLLERTLDDDAKEQLRLEAAMQKAKPSDRRGEEIDFVQGLEARGELLLFLRRDEEAAQAYQHILDVLPTHDRAKYAEGKIQTIIGGKHDSDRGRREQVEKALKGECDDFYADPELEYRLRRAGLAGVEALVKELEAACLGRPGLASAWSRFYRSAAQTFAEADDCARARRHYLKSYTFGSDGNRSFMHVPKLETWCNHGFDESTFPTKVRVYALAKRDSYDHEVPKLSDAVEELFTYELMARGVAVESKGSSSGHTDYFGVQMLWVGPELELGVEVERVEQVGNANRYEHEVISTMASKGGRLSLEALLKPFMAEVKPGDELPPFKPSSELTVATILDYSEALKLFQARKWEEAKAAFEALVAREPQLTSAKWRAKMAAEQLAKKK